MPRVASAEDGKIARRIANAVLLLERGIVLLVDHDQADLGQWGEYREPRADDDPRLAVQCGPPVAAAGGLAQFTVQTDQAGGRKTGGKTRFELRRQVDFRDQQQRLPSGSQSALDQPQIDLGLAAAGHAVQQVGTETFGAFGNRGQRRLLFERSGRAPACAGKGVFRPARAAPWAGRQRRRPAGRVDSITWPSGAW